MGKSSNNSRSNDRDEDYSTRDSYRAPDPVRVASSNPSSSPARAVDTSVAVWSGPAATSGSVLDKFGPQEALVTGNSVQGAVFDTRALVDTPGRKVDEAPSVSQAPGSPDAAAPGKVPDPVRVASRRASALRLDPARLVTKQNPAPDPERKNVGRVQQPRPQQRSDDKPREDKRCKPRPESNKPNPKGSGGGGSFRRFVPWCS